MTKMMMRKPYCLLAIATLLCAGAVAPAAATTIFFSENFNDLTAWTRKETSSFATVNGGTLTFNSGNVAGDIFTTEKFSNGFINFDYRGKANMIGGGFVGLSQDFPGGHTWLAGSGLGVPFTLVNDGEWKRYSIPFSGTGHIMLEQYWDNTPGVVQFRNLTVSDSPVTAIPEPGSYGLVLTGLALMAGFAYRRSKRN